jgi:PAS domain S-box-containing protein
MVVNRESIVDHREKRRKDERARKRPGDDFRALVDSSADGMIVLDRDGYVLYVNPAAEALFSMPASDMVGRMFGFPIVRDEPVELYLLREFKAFVAAEMRLVEVAWAGEPSYLISFRDLTDRIAAEQAMRRSRDELEAIVSERTRELARINEQLELEIDERKYAEEQLHESYRFTATFLGTLPCIIYRCRTDRDRTMEFLSPGAKKITGYNVTDLSYNTKVSYGQIIHPDDRERVWVEVQEAIHERKPLDITYGITTAGGEVKWVWEQGRSRFKNREIYLEGYIFDITDKKRVEEELARSNRLLDTLLTRAPVGFAYFDRELRYVLINDLLAEINGFPAGEHIGKHVSDIVPSLVPAIEKVVDQIMATGQPVKNHEFSGETAQAPGVLRYWSESWYPVRDSSGEIVGFGAVVEEITEHKRAEEALRESQSRLTLAQQVGQVGVFDWDLTTNKAVWTPELEDIFGIPHGQFESVYDGWARRVHPEDLPRIERYFKDWLLSGNETGEWEYRFIKDGEIRWIAARGRIFYDPEGRPLRMVGTNLDITDRKTAEDALLDSRNQAELYLDIMAHDINNLNQSALLNLELLRLDERMAEEERDMVGSALVSIQGSIGIIENVRKIQRIAAGEEHPEPEDLHYLVQQAIREASRPQGKEVDIRYEGQPGKMVLGIPLLKEAFSNLVNNAIKYSGPSVKIDVAIDEVIEGGKRCYEVSVSDNGFGIPGDVKPRLFRRFQRGTTRAHGKGLGLYIVKMLVENTGGSVRVEDRVPGDYRQGSRFVVVLPAMEQ